MASFPKDQFDDFPRDLERVGAHRGPKRRGRGWIVFGWAALATVVLFFGGLIALNRMLGIDFGLPIFAEAPTPTPTPSAIATMDPVTDPSTLDPAVKITVLNATGTSGVQNTVGDELTAAGWPVASRLNAAEPVDETFIYYSDPLNEGAARGLSLALGIGQITLIGPEVFPGQPIVLSVGVDYVGGAPEE